MAARNSVEKGGLKRGRKKTRAALPCVRGSSGRAPQHTQKQHSAQSPRAIALYSQPSLWSAPPVASSCCSPPVLPPRRRSSSCPSSSPSIPRLYHAIAPTTTTAFACCCAPDPTRNHPAIDTTPSGATWTLSIIYRNLANPYISPGAITSPQSWSYPGHHHRCVGLHAKTRRRP